MKNILPVITLYQPWATWIMRRWKTIETRTHNRLSCLNNRTVLIHSGQRTDDSDLTVKNPYLTTEQILYNPDEVINGYILGSVFIYDARKLTAEDSQRALIDCGTADRYGLFLSKVHKFPKPIAVKGEMGIWYFDIDNQQKVKKTASQTSIYFQ